VVTINGVAQPAVAATTFTALATNANMIAGGNNVFTVAAQLLSGTTAATSTSVSNGPAIAPVVFNASAGAPGTITLNWANSPANVNNVSGFTLSWTQLTDATGVAVAGATITEKLAPTATGATVVNLVSKATYAFLLVANSNLTNGNSAPVATTPAATPAP
jgi:hypothetical protein